MQEPGTLEEFEKAIKNNIVSIAYFSHEKCNVCHVLLPKVENLINTSFPKAQLFYCNTVHHPEIAAQNRIFTVPSVKIFIEGKEYISFSRNMGLAQLSDAIERPYKMLFDAGR